MGTLIGVFAVLILLMVTIVLLMCVYSKRVKGKQDTAEGDMEYDDVIEKGRTLTNPIEMKANEAYGTHQQDSMEAQYEELP